MMKLYTIVPHAFQLVMRPFVRVLLIFFCNLQVEGLQHIDNTDDNFILASKHIHELDGFLLPAVIPISAYHKPIFPVGREKSFYKHKGMRGKFYGGNFFRLMGAYPAYGGLQNYEKSLRHHTQILNDDHSVLIFPEGEATKEKIPKKIKAGVGFLTHRTRTPVISVHISGIYGMNFWSLISRKHKMKISFSRPISLHEMNISDKSLDYLVYKKIATRISERMKQK